MAISLTTARNAAGVRVREKETPAELYWSGLEGLIIIQTFKALWAYIFTTFNVFVININCSNRKLDVLCLPENISG